MDPDLLLKISEGGISEPPRLDKTTRSLIRELRTSGISASTPRHTATPSGSKGLGAGIIGGIAIAITPSLLPKIIQHLRSWHSRANKRKVFLRWKNQDVELEFELLKNSEIQSVLTTLMEFKPTSTETRIPCTHTRDPSTNGQGLKIRATEELARLFHDRDTALFLLEKAGFPRSQVPQSQIPLIFWTQVVNKAQSGILIDGITPILEAASDLYPHNPAFSPLPVKKNTFALTPQNYSAMQS